jgi:hypothetical protein
VAGILIYSKDSEAALVLYCPGERYIEPLETLLYYCYMNEYPSGPNDTNLHWHLYVHHLAVHYGVTDLRHISAQYFIDSIHVYCGKTDENLVAEYLQKTVGLKALDMASTRLLKQVILTEFKSMIEKLQSEGKAQEALVRMEQNPRAAAELFNMMLPSNGNITTSSEWRCKGCGTSFLYNEKSNRQVELTSCPCCLHPEEKALDASKKRNYIRIDE